MSNKCILLTVVICAIILVLPLSTPTKVSFYGSADIEHNPTYEDLCSDPNYKYICEEAENLMKERPEETTNRPYLNVTFNLSEIPEDYKF